MDGSRCSSSMRDERRDVGPPRDAVDPAIEHDESCPRRERAPDRREDAVPVHPVQALCRDGNPIARRIRERFGGCGVPRDVRMRAAGQVTREREHGRRRIDGVDVRDTRREPPRNLAGACPEVENDARAVGDQSIEDVEHLVRIRWPEAIRIHDRGIRELGTVLGPRPRGLSADITRRARRVRTAPRSAPSARGSTRRAQHGAVR